MNIDEFRAMQKAEKEQPKEESVSKVEEVVEEPKVEEPKEPEKPVTYEVDGKELTVDELMKGYLRQSDYTKKTTDVSKMRKEHAKAIELFELVQSSPALQEKLKEAGGDKAVIDAANQEQKRIRDLESQIASMELDKQLTNLKAKYPDFNETKVIAEAAKRKTTDLEFVYKATRTEKDGDTMTAKERETLKAEIRKELEAELKPVDADVPPTIINGRASAKDIKQPDGPTMSRKEQAIARGMGLSDADYIKYRDKK